MKTFDHFFEDIAEREKQKSANDKKRMAKERAQGDAMKEG